VSKVGQKERLTQFRLVRLFTDKLKYGYLGHWKDRGGSNIEEEHLRDWLRRQGYSEQLIKRALHALLTAAGLGGGKTLYDANAEVYELLRYGVKVKKDVGEGTVTVWLIDWNDSENNDFAIAEEVTVLGVNDKRPDIVVYVNGIALAILELKRSIVSVAEGIRQNLDSQKPEFIRPFFTTVQLVLAGNDTEGLRYSVIETPEKYTLTWKEPSAEPSPLDRAVAQLCSKERLLDLIHNFIAFDAGTKKICRHNQYFGVKRAEPFIERREGGIIWHTQGSGKSLTMVWLAKWIRENVEDARVLLITDRAELDEQIERVFKGVGEKIHRTSSGADLVDVLAKPDKWLIASLVHKFGSSEEGDIDKFVEDIRSSLPDGFKPKGTIFVFVDECHRTQSGKLHTAMSQAILPNATFIGFTGTPLLKKDKAQRSTAIFGPYIHEYKYSEAVTDNVVLDLRYEARDIDQNVTAQDKVDQWFESKTDGLSDNARAQLKSRWGTMQEVLSSKDRLSKIVADILLDMELRPRLKSGYGNAILVAGSIYQACRLYEMFQQGGLAGKCAIVTSYKPSTSDIKGEESGEGQTELIERYETYRKMLAQHFGEPEETAVTKVEQFEKEVKERFIKQPGQMKLLIVVDKLLTGFDAPSATYLYIDKTMRDHGLFQAICRVNRLDGDDKEYGYVIDYKDLFKSLRRSLLDYTGEALAGYDDEDVAGLLKDRLALGKEKLDERLDQVKALCEPVAPPGDTQAYFAYFCGPPEDKDALSNNEPKRLALYAHANALLRAYADIANEMVDAGFTEPEAERIRDEVSHFEKVRDEVKLGSGDYIDLKLYEPSMRFILDAYVRAEESVTVTTFDDKTLVELLAENGPSAVSELPDGIKKSEDAMGEAIENNVRQVIVDETPVNPKYYEKMSELLEALILARKKRALDYKVYLEKMVGLAKKVTQPSSGSTYPPGLTTGPLRAFYDNLGQDEALAIEVDRRIRHVKKADWRGNKVKEKEVRVAIKQVIGDDCPVDAILEIAKSQPDY